MRFIASVALISTLLVPALSAQPMLETVVDGFQRPVAVTHAGDERLFVAELEGRVRLVVDGQILDQPFLDITDRASDIPGFGIWSLAFHPDYPTVPWVFVHYAEQDTEDAILARFEVSPDDPNRALENSETVLLRMPKPVRQHYGGQLAFGPDGYLYIATGDGSDGVVGPDPLCSPQKLSSLEGKILRLDVDRGADVSPFYSIPPDNPFSSGTNPEIWSYGLRNPWRFSFDRETGDAWISDVGQNAREEVNRQPAGSAGGQNYGWKVMEGTLCFDDLVGCEGAPPCGSPAYTDPVLEYGHEGARCSIIGGYVYRGSLVPSLYGQYLFTDLCSGEFGAAPIATPAFENVELLPFRRAFLNSFGEDARGELYVVGNGTLSRLVDASVGEAGVVEFVTTSGQATEGDDAVVLSVRRVGDGVGAVSATVATVGGTAAAGQDYTAVSTVLSWADGDLGTRTVTIPLLDDDLFEATETLEVAVRSPTGGAVLGPRSTFVLTLSDDGGCSTGGAQLCVTQNRFRITATWETDDAAGQAVPTDLTADSGYFWFFESTNPELFVKVLDACGPPFDRFWVFIAGLTNVGTEITVTDLQTDQTKVYTTAVGQGFEAIRDTDAFATCP